MLATLVQRRILVCPVFHSATRFLKFYLMLAVLAAEPGDRQALSRGGEKHHHAHLWQNDLRVSLNSASECVGPCTSPKPEPAIGNNADGDVDGENEEEAINDGSEAVSAVDNGGEQLKVIPWPGEGPSEAETHENTTSTVDLDLTDAEVIEDHKGESLSSMGSEDRMGPEFAILFLFVMLLIGCFTRLALEYINSIYSIRIPYSVMLMIIGVLIGAMTWQVILQTDGKVILRKFAMIKLRCLKKILKRTCLHSPPNNSPSL